MHRAPWGGWVRGVTVALGLVVAAGCGGRTGGWQRVARGGCEVKAPPRLCVLAGPEAAQVVTVEGVALVPGECAAGSRARMGRVRVELRDGRSGRVSARELRVRAGETAMISGVQGEALRYERRRCGRDGG